MALFKLRCVNEGLTKIILIVLNIFLIIWGIIHLAFAGSNGLVKNTFTDAYSISPSYAGVIRQIKSLTQSPIAYFVIAGVFQILTGVITLLVLFEILGKYNRLLFFRITIALLVFSLAFEFCIAVYTAFMIPYLTEAWDSYISVDQVYVDNLPQLAKDVYNSARNHYRFMKAETVLTFVLALPSIVVILFSLIDEFVNEETIKSPAQITPSKIAIQEKSQVQSFGTHENIQSRK